MVDLIVLRDNGTWFTHEVVQSEVVRWQGVYRQIGWQVMW